MLHFKFVACMKRVACIERVACMKLSCVASIKLFRPRCQDAS